MYEVIPTGDKFAIEKDGVIVQFGFYYLAEAQEACDELNCYVKSDTE